MNEALKDINNIIGVCETLEQFIYLHGTSGYRNDIYEQYKQMINSFDTAYRLEFNNSPKIKYLRYQITKLFWNGKYTISYEEAQDIKSVIIQLKHALFPDSFEKIFISHREMDKEQVHAFIELLYAIGIPRPLKDEDNPIFCSSHPAAYIENGCPISAEIKRQFTSHAHTFYILWYTGNYFRSQACLNEAGAVWVMDKKYQEILYPNMDRNKIQGLLDKQPISFCSNDVMRLNTFKEQVEKMFDLSPVNQNYWETARNTFVDKINEIYAREQRG